MDAKKDWQNYTKQLTSDFETELANISGGYRPVDPSRPGSMSSSDTDAGVDALNGLL